MEYLRAVNKGLMAVALVLSLASCGDSKDRQEQAAVDADAHHGSEERGVTDGDADQPRCDEQAEVRGRGLEHEMVAVRGLPVELSRAGWFPGPASG